VRVTGEGASDEESAAPVELLRRVRSLPGCRYTPTIVFIEQNGTGNSCGYVGKALQLAFGNSVMIISSRRDKTPGVIKTFEVTRAYGRQWRPLLSQRLCAVHVNCATYKNTLEQELYVLDDSFGNFRYENELINDTNRRRWRLTAKTADRSDDMFIALLMTLYWKTYFFCHTVRYRDELELIRLINTGRIQTDQYRHGVPYLVASSLASSRQQHPPAIAYDVFSGGDTSFPSASNITTVNNINNGGSTSAFPLSTDTDTHQ
jgi:hypothetical protein